jgi:hypothetical protein
MQKNVDSLKICMVYLKVLGLWMIFEMMSDSEMYVICCITVIERAMCYLWFMLRFVNIAKARWHGCMFDQLHQHDHSKRTFPMDRVVRASICNTENSDASAMDFFVMISI